MLQGLAALGFAAVPSAAMVFAFPRAVVEIALSHALGRAVSIGGLEVAWGTTIVLHVRALTIAGDADATAEALLTAAAIDARIDRAKLLRGTLAFRSVAIALAASYQGHVATLAVAAGSFEALCDPDARPGGAV